MNFNWGMREIQGICGILTILALHVLPAPVLSGTEVLYRQPFANNSGGFQQSWAYGWDFYYGASAIEGTHLSNRVHYFSGSSVQTAVNAEAPSGDAIIQGYWVINSTHDQLGYTELVLPLHRYAELEFGMELNAVKWKFRMRHSHDNTIQALRCYDKFGLTEFHHQGMVTGSRKR